MGRKDTVLSLLSLDDVNIVANPYLQYGVRRSQVGSYSTTYTKFGRGIERSLYRSYVRLVCAGSVFVRDLTLVYYEYTTTGELKRMTIRVPFGMKGKEFLSGLKGKVVGGVRGLESKGVGGILVS